MFYVDAIPCLNWSLDRAVSISAIMPRSEKGKAAAIAPTRAITQFLLCRAHMPPTRANMLLSARSAAMGTSMARVSGSSDTKAMATIKPRTPKRPRQPTMISRIPATTIVPVFLGDCPSPSPAPHPGQNVGLPATSLPHFGQTIAFPQSSLTQPGSRCHRRIIPPNLSLQPRGRGSVGMNFDRGSVKQNAPKNPRMVGNSACGGVLELADRHDLGLSE